jgi:hypothetical protein
MIGEGGFDEGVAESRLLPQFEQKNSPGHVSAPQEVHFSITCVPLWRARTALPLSLDDGCTRPPFPEGTPVFANRLFSCIH